MGITKPPISMKKFQTELEHIPQEHFVRKSDTKAVTKHEPKEEPKFGQKDSFSIGDNTFYYTETEMPITTSYDPNITFQMNGAETSYSFNSVEEAVANGKDTDLVVMKVGDVRKMEERIRILEREVMKSHSSTSAKEQHQDMMLEMERKRIRIEEQIRQQEAATDTKRMELEKAMLSRKYQSLNFK